MFQRYPAQQYWAQSCFSPCKNYYYPHLLMRKQSDTQPAIDWTPAWVCRAPVQGLFPQSSHRHAPITEAHTHPHAHSPLSQSHTPQTLLSCTHALTHFQHELNQTLHVYGFTLASDTSPTHIHPSCGSAITLSHLRDSLHSPHTHSSCTGLPPRKNQSRTNIFQERKANAQRGLS